MIRACSRESSRLISDVKRNGIMTAWSAAAPSASAAIASVSAESTPPDKPSTAPRKPFLRT